MSDKDLRILLQAEIDTSNQAIKKINDQIKNISGQIDKLNIGIDLGDIDKLQKSIQQIENQFNKNNKGVKIIDEDSVKKIKNLETNIDDIVNKYKELGNVKISKNFDPATKQVKDFTIELEKANGIVERINYEGLKILREDGNHDYAYRLNTIKEVNNQMKQQEQILQREHQIRNDIAKRTDDQNQKLEHQLELYKRQAQVNAQNLRRQFGNSIGDEGRKELENYLNSVEKLKIDTPNVRQEMDRLNMKFREVASEVKTASNRVMGFGEQLRIAMSRIPVWVTGMTMFYAPLRGLQQAVETIIQLDDQMTSLSRVTDQTKEQMESFFNDTIQLADQLSVKITDLNEAIIGFSRMGYRGQDLLDMAESATIMAGVSDLSIEESMSRIVSAMQIFGIEAEDATDKIVSFMNEIDNNFAITTADLSDGLAKAGATANSFGVDMATTLGHITAIGEASRESGNIIGNSLKTIYSRITTMNASRDILDSVGISIKDLNGDVRDVSDILEELAGKWNTLSAEQQQNLGVTLAGRYQLSRFLLLMQNFHRSQEATASALSSQNSAQDEYSKYLDSYTARINKMKNAFIELSVSLERSFLGDSLKIGIGLIEDVTKTFSNLIDTVGALPLAFGTIGLAIGALHPPTRTLINNQIQLGLSTTQTGKAMVITANSAKGMATMYTSATIAAQRLTAVMGGLATGARVLGGALLGIGRFLIGVALPIAGFMALGYAISKVTEKIMDYREQQKQLREQTEKLSDSYSKNKEEINSLVAEYKSLDSQTRNATQEERFLEISNKLNELLPNLTSNIDEKGQAHLKNAQDIDKEIEKTKQLAEAQNNLDKATTNQTLSDADKNVRDAISNEQKASRAIDNNDILNLSEEQLAELELKRLNAINQRAEAEKAYNEEVANTAELFAGVSLNDELKQDLLGVVQNLDLQEMSVDEVVAKTKELGQEYGNIATISQTFGNSFSTDFLKKFSDDQLALLSEISNAHQSGFKDWDLYRTKLVNAGIDGSLLVKIMDILNTEITEQSDVLGMTSEDLATLNQAYDDAISRISSINGYLEEFQENNSLSADSINEIIQEYPDLIQFMNDEEALIEQLKQKRIEESEVAREVLQTKLKNDEAYYQNVLKMNQDYFNNLGNNYNIDFENYRNLEQAKGKLTGKLLQELSNAWSKYFNVTAQQLSSFMDENMNLNTVGSDYLRWLPNEQKRAMIDEWGRVKKIVDGFNSITMPEINLDFSNIGVSSPKSSKSGSGKSGTGSGSKSSSKNEPDKVSPSEFIEAEIRSIKSQNDSLEETNEKLKERLEKEEDYTKQLELTNKLIKGQEDQVKSLRTENEKLHNKANEVRNKSGFNTSGWFDSNGELTEEYLQQYDKASKSTQEEMSDTVSQLQLLKKAYTSNQEQIKSLTSSNVELADSLEEINQKIIDEKLSSYDSIISGIDRSISKVQKEIELLDEESDDYYFSNYNAKNREINKQLEWKAEIYKREIEYLESQNKLTDEQKIKLSELRLAHMDVGIEIKNNNDQLKHQADKVIDEIKKVYEKRKEIIINAIEEEIKAEDKRHKSVMDDLDDELKKYEELANTKLKSLDRDKEDEDFQKELTKLQNERQAHQQGIDILSLDNSIEITAKKKELEEQLAEATLNIEALKVNRKRDLRKREINDNMDAYKKDIEEKKKTENNKHDAEKERLDTIKKETEQHFQDLFNNEQYWEARRQELLNGNIQNLKSKLSEYLTDFKTQNKSVIAELATNWSSLNTMIDNIASKSIYSSQPSNSNNSPSIIEQMKSNAQAWKNTNDPTLKKQLELENQRLGQSIGASYNSTTGTWWKDNKRLFHDGGFVGGNQSKIGTFIDKLFKMKPNEMTTKSLIGEYQAPPKLFPNAIGNIQNMITHTKQSSSQPTSISIGSLMHVDKIDKNVNVDKLVNQVSDKFIKTLRLNGLNV